MGDVVIIGALIHDDFNRLFLMTSPKWKGYGLPGGKPNPNEYEEDTVRREVREEIGIELTDLVKAEEIILPPTDQIDRTTTFIVKPYFAKALTTRITRNNEVGKWGWYTVKEALQLPLLDPIRKTVEAYSLL
ncbi:MAG TPA: NUDIX domain-containing protein [Candidatus Nanoarchaeia archaeon]|nr:NUDIX domain-containing protein [Candidatus Nanoarchaeia archaeon]